MSWDVSLQITNGHESADVEDCGNYTYNVSPMYYDALGGTGLRGLDGLACAVALPLIQSAVAKMADDPAKYRAMDPPNKWGDYESALIWLRQIGEACERHPSAVVRVT
jgi:hypothetical protein